MSKVRVLVGTKKGAFILTADGKRDKWEVSGPHFAGWEMYHLKGSPADPQRIADTVEKHLRHKQRPPGSDHLTIHQSRWMAAMWVGERVEAIS